MTIDCGKLSEFLFRRTPDFDKALSKDRFPYNYSYVGMYPVENWESFSGTTHTADKVHVAMDNDDGCWDAMDASDWTNGDCAKQNMCDPNRLEIGWGSTRRTYGKYHRDYQTKPFCLDKIRHVEEARAQLSGIVEGLKDLPEQISSSFLRLLAVRQADYIHICGSSFTKVTVSDSIFTNQCTKIALGSANSLPASKLTMQYLNHFLPTLMSEGYVSKQFIPDAKFLMMTDIQTQMELCNANPALSAMYNAADFAKGGKFFQYGAMTGCGNFVFKIDPTPLRFYHVGGGVLQRVWPYQNVSATVGIKPQFDPNYESAPYQLYHIYNKAARKVYTGEVTSVNPDMPFAARGLMGKWSWKNPDVIIYTDPETGAQCTFRNDKHNRGYFLGEYEIGMDTIYPKIEMWILALREQQPVADVPRVASVVYPTTDGSAYQSLVPYNHGCQTTDEV